MTLRRSRPPRPARNGSAGEPPRSALTIGVCMNTRGLMELIVLNIGKDLMLVIMALVSTFIAAPLIRWLMKGQELGEPVAAGG
ncbi:MAG: hypothetical protein DMD87_09900 [Candidatus Rokuibacteriota bacterium]|nr:MAG: hypothetical protein DMD87_09900 [Candidatus Rokubacteria bacterium]